MQELEANADSVNFLINELCRSIARQHGTEHETSVAKLKAQSFEILLKKSRSKSPQLVNDFEPQRALDVQIFAAKLNVNANSEECAKFAAFDDHLASIEEEQYFTNGAGKLMLQLLLELQGNISDAYDVRRKPCLLVPGPFTLHAGYHNNQHYPANANQSLKLPSPKYFKGVQEIQKTSNPYLPKFLFDGEPNILARIEKKFAATSAQSAIPNSCSFTSMTQGLWGDSMRINVKAFRLFTDCSGVLQQQKSTKTVDDITKVPLIKVAKTITTKQPAEPERRFSWNWENLGNFGVICSKPFASESNVALHLQSIHQHAMGQKFEAKIVTQKQFLKDLKSLTVGIQSDSFVHDEYIVFSMQPHITIDGVLPATINNFTADFLECGTCYKRMQTMIMKRDYKLMFEGFMFKALCSAIDEYLITFRQYVFSQEDEYLMQFYKRMKKMMNQISNLSFTLAIHPNVDLSAKPPMGSQFLGYLYREIMRLTEKDYITLLVFILKRCCHVYFKHFQKWIFYGILDDPSNELFIGFVDHYRQNTKYFYDKAYFVRKESVPGFFQNFEDQILQCGKYTMLLKAYKPNHPLFDLEYPAISVCLTFDEILALESTCSKYFERARELCGKPITIRQVFDTRAEQKRNFFQMVSQRSRENMEKWSHEQHALAIVAAEQKKKRLEELTTQLQDAKQRKIDDRRANVELELKSLKDAEKLEEQRLLRENINLRKRIEYYQELSDMMQCDANEAHIKQIGKLTPQISDETLAQPLTLKQTPHTPISASTDFESCDGDEDASSLYAECISDEFVINFEQTEEELRAIFTENVLENNNERRENQIGDSKEVEQNAATVVATSTLKRSASDYLNSNELPELLSVLQKNREKALSGTTMKDCVKDMQPLKVTTDDSEVVALTEAQSNKLKVMSHDFGSLVAVQTKSLPDINLNTMSVGNISELQRNRKRMMQNDTFSEFNKDPLADRKNLNLELNDTERSKNRRKVLESEFNILTGKTTSTTTFAVEEPVTPMSTTSDRTPNTVDNITSVFRAALTITKKNDDLENGNIENKPVLKIDVAAATQKQPSQAFLNTASSEWVLPPNTATSQFTAPTPECALNTAGINAKQGFNFHTDQEQKQIYRKKQQAEAAEAPIQNAQLQQPASELFPTLDYNTPYKRCRELIETNFKCATRSPYFRLNIAAKKTPLEVTQSTESMRRSMNKQLNLNSMSVITLTEFLQKSMIIPMNTHLEIVNNEVMRMFLEDLQILAHFKSLRNYFFLMDGEFGAFICDGIIGKLEEDGATPEKLLNYQMLHSVLENALGSSIIGNDKNAANLSFIVSDVPAIFDHSSPKVLDILCLSYSVDWPLNLILNPETLEHYANIFKYLIKVRRISWVLERAYQMLKEAVKRYGKAILQSPQYRHVQQIRHKFYHFVHALQNHITANALQASWKTFKDDLLHAKSIEDIYRKHTTYVKRIFFLCMLNRRSVEFYNTIENIFRISLRFYNNLKSRDFKKRSGDEFYTHSRYEKLAADELDFDKFIKYTIYLGNKIVRHGYQEEIGEFISLINYNNYYIETSS